MVLAPGVSPAPSPCAAPGAGCEFPSLLLCCPARGLFLYSRYSMKRDCGTGPRVCIQQNAKPTVPAAQTLPVARCVWLFYNPCLSFGTLQPGFVTSGRSQVPPCASPCVVTCVSARAGEISAVPVCFPSARCEELALDTWILAGQHPALAAKGHRAGSVPSIPARPCAAGLWAELHALSRPALSSSSLPGCAAC